MSGPNFGAATTAQPTHYCALCGAYWKKWADGTWSLTSKESGKCCDNAPMDFRIQELRP